MPHVVSDKMDRHAYNYILEFSNDWYILSCKGDKHSFNNVKELKVLMAKYKPLIGEEKVLMAPEGETKYEKIKEVVDIIQENGLSLTFITREKLQ